MTRCNTIKVVDFDKLQQQLEFRHSGLPSWTCTLYTRKFLMLNIKGWENVLQDDSPRSTFSFCSVWLTDLPGDMGVKTYSDHIPLSSHIPGLASLLVLKLKKKVKILFFFFCARGITTLFVSFLSVYLNYTPHQSCHHLRSDTNVIYFFQFCVFLSSAAVSPPPLNVPDSSFTEQQVHLSSQQYITSHFHKFETPAQIFQAHLWSLILTPDPSSQLTEYESNTSGECSCKPAKFRFQVKWQAPMTVHAVIKIQPVYNTRQRNISIQAPYIISPY